MSIPRCYVPPECWGPELVALDADNIHHLRDVLRQVSGASVMLFDGVGREAEAELVAGPGRNAVTARVSRVIQHPRPAVELILLQAIPKTPRMDWLIEKAVELGVTELHPMQTARTVVSLADERIERKAARWQRLATAAARQCGTPWLTRILPPAPFAETLARGSWDALLVGSLEPNAPPFREVVAGIRAAAPRRLALLIGPEGDFTLDEYAAAQCAGARAVRFGAAVLRVETAAISGVTLLAYEFRA